MMTTFQFSLTLVRGIGLYMLADACAALLGETLQVKVVPPRVGDPYWVYEYLDTQRLFSGGIGLLFLLRATPFARLLARGTYPDGHCQRCGYTPTEIQGTRCPECGDSGPTAPRTPTPAP